MEVKTRAFLNWALGLGGHCHAETLLFPVAIGLKLSGPQNRSRRDEQNNPKTFQEMNLKRRARS